MALRYSAGSKEGLRKGCSAGSETCVDFGSKVMTGTVRCACRGFEAALLFWRRREVFESQAIAVRLPGGVERVYK